MIGNFLKRMRDSGYSGKTEKPDPSTDENAVPDSAGGDQTETSRIISLLDDEMTAFQGARPGEDIACEVHGSLEEDGHFHVLSVQPLNKGKDYGSEKEMASEVAQRVTPTAQISPS